MYLHPQCTEPHLDFYVSVRDLDLSSQFIGQAITLASHSIIDLRPSSQNLPQHFALGYCLLPSTGYGWVVWNTLRCSSLWKL